MILWYPVVILKAEFDAWHKNKMPDNFKYKKLKKKRGDIFIILAWIKSFAWYKSPETSELRVFKLNYRAPRHPKESSEVHEVKTIFIMLVKTSRAFHCAHGCADAMMGTPVGTSAQIKARQQTTDFQTLGMWQIHSRYYVKQATKQNA